jgi:transposase-like protein
MANSYTDETKGAVMAALLEGQSVSSVAKDYEIPKGTVSRWKKTALSEGVREERTQKEPGDIGDLLLELLRTNVESLIAISKTTQDAEWIKKQDAAELATFFGVKHDKVVRMVEALNGADAERD